MHIDEIMVGDVIHITNGEIIPSDGIVLECNS